MGTESSQVGTTRNLSDVTPSLEREAVYACRAQLTTEREHLSRITAPKRSFRTHNLEVRQRVGFVNALELQESQHVQVPRQPPSKSAFPSLFVPFLFSVRSETPQPRNGGFSHTHSPRGASPNPHVVDVASRRCSPRLGVKPGQRAGDTDSGWLLLLRHHLACPQPDRNRRKWREESHDPFIALVPRRISWDGRSKKG